MKLTRNLSPSGQPDGIGIKVDTAHDDLTFNVAQLLKESVGSTRNLKINTPALVLSDASVAPDDPTLVEAQSVEGEVKITRVLQDLLVQGKVSATVELVCSRCLERFTLPVTGNLEEKYVPTVEVETGHPVQRTEFEDDDTAFEINSSHEIDLTEPVRQALLVALPMRPLCREDCAGLCPTCGKNLNDGPCECESETVDNRWAALEKLKIEDFPSDDGNLN